MATSKQIQRLATHPGELARFQRTGKLPAGVIPRSPLITLVEGIGRCDLSLIGGLTVDHRLGYAGSRTFASAAQALAWIKPAPEVFGTFPAESWRDKRFVRQLKMSDLVACCLRFPEGLIRIDEVTSTSLLTRRSSAP